MRKLLALLILLGIVVASAGCIREGDGGIIISFGNQTYTIPLQNQTNQSLHNENQTIKTHINRYEKLVQVNQTLYIKELNFPIRVDYDVVKHKFFFITPDDVYFEPMNITVNDTRIIGRGYFAGTHVYLANITVISPRNLTITVG